MGIIILQIFSNTVIPEFDPRHVQFGLMMIVVWGLLI
jgi:hypothetical protein